MAKKTKRRRRRRSAGNTALMNRAKVAGWTSLYGYVKEQKNYLRAVPKIDAIGQDATMMVAAHLLAKHGPRVTRKPLDAIATGLAGVVGYRLGASGYSLSSLQGWSQSDQDLVGALDPQDFVEVTAGDFE